MYKNVIHLPIISFIIFLSSCEDITPPDADINYAIIEPLSNVVKRDLLIFENKAIPDTAINLLSHYKAIIFGEMHTIGEERELVSNLAIELSKAGEPVEFCAECPQAYSWIYEKVSAGELANLPSWVNYPKMLPILNSLQNYNASTQNKIKLLCVDRNAQINFFYNSLTEFTNLTINSELADYINNFPDYTSSDYFDSLYEFESILTDNPNSLGLSKTDEHYIILSRMVMNEIESITIRENWESDYETSFSKREDLIKSNADYYLSQTDGLIVFYFGSYHAQKERFLGSDIEWLGDYLHNRNSFSKNKSISIVGIPLKGEIINSSNTGTMKFNLSSQSKPDDLFKITADINQNNYSILFLSDSIFLEKNIRAKYIYEGSEVVIPTKKQYDAFVFIPEGTYVGW